MFLVKVENMIDKNNEKLQENKDTVAVILSKVMGANVVRRSEYNQLLEERQALLEQNNDISKIKSKLIKTYCRLLAFIEYHKKWKPITKKLSSRLSVLQKEKIHEDFSAIDDQIDINLKEAYNCYVNGQTIACYIMVLRTTEFVINKIYHNHIPIEYLSNNREKFVPAVDKLNWIKKEKMIGGADFQVMKAFIESRNEAVHGIFNPTDKQLFAAFETVIKLVKEQLIFHNTSST